MDVVRALLCADYVTLLRKCQVENVAKSDNVGKSDIAMSEKATYQEGKCVDFRTLLDVDAKYVVFRDNAAARMCLIEDKPRIASAHHNLPE